MYVHSKLPTTFPPQRCPDGKPHDPETFVGSYFDHLFPRRVTMEDGSFVSTHACKRCGFLYYNVSKRVR